MLEQTSIKEQSTPMIWVNKIPNKLEEILGLDGSLQFRKFLNSTLNEFRNEVLGFSSNRFERRLQKETYFFKEEIKELREDVRGMRLQTKEEIHLLRDEMSQWKLDTTREFYLFRSEIQDSQSKFREEVSHQHNRLRTDFNDLKVEIKTEITEIHKTISTQTRWILVGMLGVGSFLLGLAKFV
ncbi:LA_3696 family protein [Leptospira stimsonii]|uniref:DUF1640 domain-containing protein n=1 Tax=Leptospira stimsonii TaxID=2202203 RepID=A0A8B3CN72_9LEPT|nr:hypothetical protein [Leptospira stimsonii]RHX83795.1 hypothetical protein DLM78_20085 [Leptospira stimsonii]